LRGIEITTVYFATILFLLNFHGLGLRLVT
jgi:hypothetical protein